MKSKKNTTGNESQGKSPSLNIIGSDPSLRNQMIANAAYFRAEKRGFYPNDDLADWFESEREIDTHINSLSS